ncbi:MAG: glycosyltransferase family 87 protein [Chloroflexota bacterium]
MIAERTARGPFPQLSTRQRRIAGYILLAAFALAGVWNLLTALQTSPFVWHDFAQDYIAAEDVLAGRNPFLPQNDRLGELFGVRPPDKEPAYSFHPPTTIPFFLPLAPLPYPAAFIAWDLVQLGCLWLIVDLTARLIGRTVRPIVSAALALGLVALWPIRESFVEGQLNIPVTAGIVGCWYALRIRRPGLAGVALALAVALKPLAGLFVLWVLWRRQWRLLVAALATGAMFALAGAGLSGVQGTLDYVTTAYPMHAALWPGYKDNASPQGFYTRLFGPTEWRPRPPYPLPGLSRALTLGTWAVAVGILFWQLGRRAPDADHLNLEFAGLGATMLLVTPIIWPHYYAVLIAPVAVFVSVCSQRHAWGWLALLAAALLLLWVPRDLHAWLQDLSLAPRAYGTFQLPGLLAVYAVGLYCLRQSPREPDAVASMSQPVP